MSVGLCQSAAKGKGKGEKNKTKKNKPKKQNKKKTKNRLMKVTKIGFLGVRSFFLFCIFLVSWFLVFWFVVGFFEGLAKQHKSEGPGPNSLPVLPL